MKNSKRKVVDFTSFDYKQVVLINQEQIADYPYYKAGHKYR
jgi:hypothetical protein